ncbi:Na+/H+ antiporter NhaC family protein [Kurthia massiliensis]|uniref:Na+/H+ antiporter NhaC family protein n=1 Tax=Kurthia massiliensis TaxID=1033739 RepID=UPI0002880D08|nr:Na+/H+ antiporter NhaC family protein [Kurthia massiliensis]
MQRTNKWALLPFVVFIVLFIGTGVISGDFTAMPLNVAVLIACVIAFLMNRKETLATKVEIFTKGAGNANVMLMVVIFVLAGAFSSVAKGMGAVDSTVNLGLSFLPPSLLIVGLFIIGCFISLSMGTSMGTVVALAPIGVGIAESTDIPMALAMATVVGGAMFGDNLSIISDTTIAAVRTQGTEMRDKFKVNFFIVLPAAIVTAVILFVLTSGSTTSVDNVGNYAFTKVLPYLIVLILALAGLNVMLVLVIGIILSGIVGFLNGSYDFLSFIKTIGEGMIGMEDIAIIAILISGLVALIQHNGGLQYLLDTITKRVKSKKGAEVGIASLVSVIDIATVNNTIAILMAGPLAKTIADKYEVDPRKSASLLDIFASVWQGLLPYSPQLLAAAGVAGISTVGMWQAYSFYPILMGITAIVAIMIGYPKLKK